MLLVILHRGEVPRLAAVIGCSGAPRERGEATPCGEYALYLNHHEDDIYFMGITLSKYWRGWEYLSEEAEGECGAQCALDLLRRLLAEGVHVLMAVGTRAPSVRPETDDNAFLHHSWVWIRKGYSPTGKAAALWNFITGGRTEPTDILLALDAPPAQLHGKEELDGGTLLWLKPHHPAEPRQPPPQHANPPNPSTRRDTGGHQTT